MAIQFFCAACHQPIEVDDDAANQSVTCPYCRKVVTAPFSSDPTVRMPGGGAIREAGPLGDAPQTSAGGTLSPLSYGTAMSQLPAGRNTIGWVAFILAILCVISFGAMTVVYGSWIASEGFKTQAEIRDRMTEIQRSGQVPPILMAVGGMSCLGLLSFVAALVTGILGIVNKRQPRWPAMVAVMVAGGMILILCAGVCMQASQAGGVGGG